MSLFHGIIKGRARNPSTQCGDRKSGLRTDAISWNGGISVELREEKFGTTEYVIYEIDHPDKGGNVRRVIEKGTLKCL